MERNKTAIDAAVNMIPVDHYKDDDLIQVHRWSLGDRRSRSSSHVSTHVLLYITLFTTCLYSYHLYITYIEKKYIRIYMYIYIYVYIYT